MISYELFQYAINFCKQANKVMFHRPNLKKPSLDSSDVSSYRPNQLQDINQSGFKPAHSTETALIAVTERLHAARSAQLSSVLILLDLSAAFDTVNHKILLSVLTDLGITGTAWKWFESYLEDCHYQVMFHRPNLKKPSLDSSDVSSYRPNQLQDINQSGFKPAHSTETALIAVCVLGWAARTWHSCAAQGPSACGSLDSRQQAEGLLKQRAVETHRVGPAERMDGAPNRDFFRRDGQHTSRMGDRFLTENFIFSLSNFSVLTSGDMSAPTPKDIVTPKPQQRQVLTAKDTVGTPEPQHPPPTENAERADESQVPLYELLETPELHEQSASSSISASSPHLNFPATMEKLLSVGTRLSLSLSASPQLIFYIFNLSLRLGRVPQLWKTSGMVLVPKTPHPKDLNSYRPVALTSHLMKTLERLLLVHLRPPVSPAMDPLQFAYQPGIGVEDAIIHLLHRSLSHLENAGSTVRIMFFDFSSAFSTIQPMLLKDKLECTGLDHHLTTWILDYLTNRPQYVRTQFCQLPPAEVL
ncbi:hypothetical protein NFI96_004663 [Prochilodus magdalenae]|nr:hypothetical protein NFI96_004663 [Prochilodus magdalenae]